MFQNMNPMVRVLIYVLAAIGVIRVVKAISKGAAAASYQDFGIADAMLYSGPRYMGEDGY